MMRNLNNTIKNIVRDVINESIKEGGVFNITGINDKGQLANQYQYDNKDKNLYIDFSQSKDHPKHPLEPSWTEVPSDISFDKTKHFEKLKNKSPRKSYPTDGYVIGPKGKFYMPTKKMYGTGDVVHKPTDSKLCVNMPSPYGDIKCYNLAALGNANPTILAHYYKGKDMMADKKFTLAGRDMNKLPGNFKEYLKDMIGLVKNIPELRDFNPTYITYPQSSSAFNGQIATVLKRFIYPQSTILGGKDLINPETNKPDDRNITKRGTWNFTFKNLFQYIKRELQKLKFSHPVLIENSIYSELSFVAAQIISYYILKILATQLSQTRDITKKTQLAIINKTFDRCYGDLLDTLEDEDVPTDNSYLDENYLYMLTIRLLFKGDKTTKYSDGDKFTKTKHSQIFQSAQNFEQAFLTDQISFKTDALAQIYGKTDSISKLTSSQRFALDGQFNGSTVFNGTNNDNVRVLIVDDNFATGASLRNAVTSIIKQGVKPDNIICLTPGGIGSAGTGAAGWIQDLPTNSAEAQMYNDYSNGRFDSIELPQSDIDRLDSLGTRIKMNKDSSFSHPNHQIKQMIRNFTYSK